MGAQYVCALGRRIRELSVDDFAPVAHGNRHVAKQVALDTRPDRDNKPRHHVMEHLETRFSRHPCVVLEKVFLGDVLGLEERDPVGFIRIETHYVLPYSEFESGVSNSNLTSVVSYVSLL